MKRIASLHRITVITLIILLQVVSASAVTYETLRPGSEGELVRAMQSGLEFVGFPISVDGKYGRLTQDAVAAFQRRQNLTADGLAGRMTLSELYRLAPQFQPASSVPSSTPASSVQSPDATTPPASSGSSSHEAYVYTQNRGPLNLRNKPAYGQTTIAQLPFGMQVTVKSVSGSWSQVSALGMTGYVVSSFLQSSPGSEAATQQPASAPGSTPAPTQNSQPGTGSQAVVRTSNSGSLNLRDKASYSGRVLAQIPYSASVNVLSRQGLWAQVSYMHLTGYVVDSFLQHQSGNPTAPSDQQTTASPPPIPSSPVGEVTGVAYVNTMPGRFLNFRNAPNTGMTIIGQIPYGTALQLLQHSSQWCEVLYQGERGFVMTSFLRFEAQATSTLPPAVTEEPVPSTSPTPESTETQAPAENILFTRVLRQGLQGEDVRELQSRLIGLKYTVSLTAVFDPMTLEAVRHFQLQNALTVDGIFGSQSAQVLLSGAARTADSPALSYQTLRIDNSDQADKAVSAMQQALKDLGYPLSVNGRYDIPTHQAVVGFQQRNGLPITGIANPLTQSTIFSGQAKGYGVSVPELSSSEGKVGGPSQSQVKLLYWFNDIKPRVSSGQNITVFHPASGISFTVRFYSLGNHADSEPATWLDTQLMNRAFGTPSWNINTVYIKLPDGQWTLAAMHNRPHLTGAISANGFGGHLCIHFLRDMDEVLRNDPDYGASNQRSIRKAWLSMTGETVD